MTPCHTKVVYFHRHGEVKKQVMDMADRFFSLPFFGPFHLHGNGCFRK